MSFQYLFNRNSNGKDDTGPCRGPVSEKPGALDGVSSHWVWPSDLGGLVQQTQAPNVGRNPGLDGEHPGYNGE